MLTIDELILGDEFGCFFESISMEKSRAAIGTSKGDPVRLLFVAEFWSRNS